MRRTKKENPKTMEGPSQRKRKKRKRDLSRVKLYFSSVGEKRLRYFVLPFTQFHAL